MPKTTPTRNLFFVLLLSSAFSGCAFFNTYYNARKAYENGVQSLRQNREQAREQNVSTGEIPFDRFSLEPKSAGVEGKQFFDIAIEKANKVVALHPQSGWVENAILLLGKAYYMRASGNDYYDAQNRFEVFLIRFPDSKYAAEAKLWYGKTLMKLRLDDQAAKTFLEILSFTADNDIRSESLIYLGDISVNELNYKTASGYYAKASATASEKVLKQHAIFKAAYCYFKLNDYKLAEEYFDALEKTGPNFSDRFDILLMKARALKLEGQYDKALSLLDDMIGDLRFKNYYIRAEFEIADVLRLKGKRQDAADQFNYVISNYKNPNVTDDAYYFLGLINDAPGVLYPDGFQPSLHVAKKYYYLVKTKFPTSDFFSAASARYDYLMRVDFLKGAIKADGEVLNRIRLKSADPERAIPPWDVWGEFRQDSIRNEIEEKRLQQSSLKAKKTHHAIDVNSVTKNITPIDTLRRAKIDSLGSKTKKTGSLRTDLLSNDDSTKAVILQSQLWTQKDSIEQMVSKRIGPVEKEDKTKDEFGDVKIINSDLITKWSAVELQMGEIDRLSDADTLKKKEGIFLDQVTEDYIALADYFYDLNEYDSAQFYYQSVTDKFPNSASQELALYALARFEQKKNNPDYLRFYQHALSKFPNGKLAGVGRQFLSLDEPITDSSQYRFEQAEKSLIKDGDVAAALRWYRTVAHDNTSRFKLSALYAMGLLYENKLADYPQAFRLYHTLTYAAPNSDWARLVRPKVDAYIQRKQISSDSLMNWIDTSYVSITRAEMKTGLLKQLDSASLSGASDSTRLRSDNKLLMKSSKPARDDSTAIRMQEFMKSLMPKKTDKDKKHKREESEDKKEADDVEKKDDRQ